MHGGAKGSGAPGGNRNALKHGVFTKESIELRATLRAQIREAQKLLKEIRG
jgi:glucans biosynthesis protein